jgi:hypothetical protein
VNPFTEDHHALGPTSIQQAEKLFAYLHPRQIEMFPSDMYHSFEQQQQLVSGLMDMHAAWHLLQSTSLEHHSKK